MKYAFIILIALYLVIYGCSPDNSEKATDSHEETVPAAVENPPKVEMVAVPEHQQESAEITQVIAPTPEVIAVEAAEQAPAEVAESEQIIMPCGRIMTMEDTPENTPCLRPQVQEPADNQEQDLAAAMQRMVKTTDEMVLATRQLIIATQKVLNAGKGAAAEASEEIKPVEQIPAAKEPEATYEKDGVETKQGVVSST